MTVAIGVLPRKERGAILLCDGLNTGYINGQQRVWQHDDKLLGLAGPAGALVVSGHVADDSLQRLRIGKGSGAVLASLARGTVADSDATTRDRLGRLYDELRGVDADVRARVGGDRYGEMDDPGPHVIAAVLQAGNAPLLARFTSKTERWAEPGDVFVIGCVLLDPPADLLEEIKRPAPDTLAECKDWAVDWVGRFIDRTWGTRDAYGLIEKTGSMPCIGFPLYVLTITEDNQATIEKFEGDAC
jgi:hypothetical protein